MRTSNNLAKHVMMTYDHSVDAVTFLFNSYMKLIIRYQIIKQSYLHGNRATTNNETF